MTDMLQFFADNPTFFLITIAILSAFIGSFLNVVIYRLPRMMEQNWSEECRIYLGLKPYTDIEKFNLYLPFSHCPHCKKTVHPWHNIPILSYFLLQGKCAYCKVPISVRYPFVETFTCLISIYIAWQFGVTLQTLAFLVFTWIGICLTFIDIDYHLLPDELTLLLLWLGLFFSMFHIFVTPYEAITGAIAGYGIFLITQKLFAFVTGKDGMGQGDLKLLAALGTYSGWQMLPLIILLGSLTGLLFAFSQMLIKRQFKSEPLPFGPYLIFAGWIAILWGNEIMQYYLGFMLDSHYT